MTQDSTSSKEILPRHDFETRDNKKPDSKRQMELQVKSDYDYSRETYYDIIQNGREAMEEAIEVARETQHPRAFEVLSGLIKNIGDVTDKLMDLNKKHKDITEPATKTKEYDTPEGKTTNNVFIGTSSDLQRMLGGHLEEIIPGSVLPKPEERDITPKD